VILTALAQQNAPTARIAVLIGAAIVVLILFGLAIKRLRSSLLGGGPSAPGETLDLGELQRQRDAGEISEEEFQSLRRAILGLPPREAGGDVSDGAGQGPNNPPGGPTPG